MPWARSFWAFSPLQPYSSKWIALPLGLGGPQPFLASIHGIGSTFLASIHGIGSTFLASIHVSWSTFLASIHGIGSTLLASIHVSWSSWSSDVITWVSEGGSCWSLFHPSPWSQAVAQPREWAGRMSFFRLSPTTMVSWG